MTDQAEPKEPRRIRRLTLADGLILIAAVAAGLAIGRIPQNANGYDDSLSLIVRYFIHFVSGAVV
jgi:hypothetical protein